MRKSGLRWPVAAFAVVFVASAVPARAQKAVIVVRHAEKVDESKDPLLSTRGQARAQSLADHLRTAGVTAIYVTQYKRTGLTAAPLALAAGLTPIVVHADTPEATVDRMRKDHAQDVVLVVGHSDTVPGILRHLGHPDPVTIGAAEYDSLFIAVPSASGRATVLRLRY